MAQTNKMELKLMDRRVMERYLRKGMLADKDVDAYLKALPDMESHGEFMPIPEPGPVKEDTAGDDDGDEADA
jgi:hypothetical protein